MISFLFKTIKPQNKPAAVIAFGLILLITAMIIITNVGYGDKFWPYMVNTPYADKVGHVGIFGTLSYFCNLAFSNRLSKRRFKIFTTTTFIILVVVTLEEISQAFIPSRTCDILDWTADLIGLALGQWLAHLTLKKASRSGNANPNSTSN